MHTESGSYPIGRPEPGGDDRSTVRLALDVAAVPAHHRYPPVSTGADLLRLQQTLFTLIYQETTR
jgi:hypothetical protein